LGDVVVAVEVVEVGVVAAEGGDEVGEEGFLVGELGVGLVWGLRVGVSLGWGRRWGVGDILLG
jgi:hypothetical protein